MEDIGFDQEIFSLLEETFKAALSIGGDYSPEQIKLMIVATNLESLAKMFLVADNKPEEVTLNLKKVALGIMGTSDWIQSSFEGTI